MSRLSPLRCFAAFFTFVPLIAIALPASGQQPDGETWMQWRGPTRDGQFYGPSWPVDVSPAHLQEIWRVPLDKSYSGPLVTKDCVFATETRDRKSEVVYCFDRQTGTELWRHEWPGSMKVPFFAASNGSWIRSTPATDGKLLFVGGIRDVLVAMDVATGEEKWRIDFKEAFDSQLPSFGMVCSPLERGEYVYVQAGASFVKLNKTNGKVVWRAASDAGGMNGSAFSSPVFATIDQRPILLVQTRQSLKTIDDNTGEELCSRDIEAFRGMNILTPTVHRDSIFTSAHSGKGELIRLAKQDAGFAFESAWNNRKLEAYMSTPVVIGDYVYMLLKNQRFCCFEWATGQEKWRSKESFGKYWSMVTQGDRILALDEQGELLLILANPTKLEIVDRRQISNSPTWAHLAAAGNELFIRELKALVAYRWK